MTAGAVELSYGSKTRMLEGPWFWVGYPGPHVRFHVAPGHPSWSHRHVAFRGPRMSEWLADHMLPLEPQRPPAEMNAVRLFDEMLSHVAPGTYWQTLRAINILERILLELAQDRAQSQAPSQEPWLPGLLEQLRNSVMMAGSAEGDASPAYEEIARKLNVSLSTLHRHFKRATGTTLHAYTLQYRGATARELLAETDLPIKAIAARLGYRDAYFFSRQFRSLTGVSPLAYRRSRQA
jgi:AraC-like DNA-binding protein